MLKSFWSLLCCRQFERDPAGVGHRRPNVRRENAGQIRLWSSCKMMHTNTNKILCSCHVSDLCYILTFFQHEARRQFVLLSPVASGRTDHWKHKMRHWLESVSSSLIISAQAYCSNLSSFIQALPLPSSAGPITINCQWMSQVNSTCLYFVHADDTDALCQTEPKLRLRSSSQLNVKAN